MPCRPYHPDAWPLIRGFSEKNVPDTCCIDIKTMSDKEEEG